YQVVRWYVRTSQCHQVSGQTKQRREIIESLVSGIQSIQLMPAIAKTKKPCHRKIPIIPPGLIIKDDHVNFSVFTEVLGNEVKPVVARATPGNGSDSCRAPKRFA